MWNFHLAYENGMKIYFKFFSWILEEILKKAHKMKSNVLRALERSSMQIFKKKLSLSVHSTDFFAMEIVNFKLLMFVVMKY